MELSEQGERAPPGLASLLDACPVGCILAPLCGCVAQSSIHIETPFKVANYMYQVAPPFRRILAKGGNTDRCALYSHPVSHRPRLRMWQPLKKKRRLGGCGQALDCEDCPPAGDLSSLGMTESGMASERNTEILRLRKPIRERIGLLRSG